METQEATDDMGGDLKNLEDKSCKKLIQNKKPAFDDLFPRFSCPRFLAFCNSKRYTLVKNHIEVESEACTYPLEDVLPAKTCTTTTLDDENVVKRYKKFRRFCIVEDFSDHLFSTSHVEYISPIYKDQIDYDRKSFLRYLPDTIFVRAYESRMDLLTVVIIGRKRTPYHNGLFFFDVFIPQDYPYCTPVVRCRTGGVCIHPLILKCGHVRLNYSDYLVWVPGLTTMSELLLMINQVLDTQPFCYLPRLPYMRNSSSLSHLLMLYNEDTLIKSLKTMIYIMNKPPKHFESFVIGHFRNHVLDILEACQAYIVGYGVCDVGNKKCCCSFEFRNEVASCIRHLVEAFSKIGATEANNFSHLSRLTLVIFGNDMVTDDRDFVAERSPVKDGDRNIQDKSCKVIVGDDIVNDDGDAEFFGVFKDWDLCIEDESCKSRCGSSTHSC